VTGGTVPPFLTSALGVGEWSASLPEHCTHDEGAVVPFGWEGRVVLIVDLDAVE
jgi:hypothetical protein